MQFTHSSSQKPEKSNTWSDNSLMLGKKLATRGNKQESITAPFLSPFICNVPVPNHDNIHPDNNSISNNDISIHDAKRSSIDGADKGDEKNQQERKLRADFAQQLIMSTIFEHLRIRGRRLVSKSSEVPSLKTQKMPLTA